MRRLISLTLLALGACTPQQIELWQTWHAEDPAAAEAFVAEGCARMCDVTTEDTIFDVPEEEPEAWGQCSQWMDDALAAGWTESQWSTLNWVMAAESNCDPGATSPAGAIGLLQVMPFWAGECGGGDLYGVAFNLSCGLHVYHQQGWTAWDVY